MRIKSVPSHFLFPATALVFLSALALTGLQGCQTSDQVTAGNPNGTGTSDLALAVVSTDSCTALKATLTGGTAADSAAFAMECIVRVLPDSERPGTEPDSGLRCVWMKQHIDSGEVAVIPAFVAEHKALCDSLKTSDTASFGKYCRIPPPPPRAKCDSLRDTLVAMDSVSQGYLKIRLAVSGLCKLPPPPPPKPGQPPRPAVAGPSAAH